MATRKKTDQAPETDDVTGKTLSDAQGTGEDETSKEGFDRTDAEDGPVEENGEEKFTTIGDGVAPSPPGWKQGDHWNSDDARKAYEAEGTTLEAEAQKGAEGEAPGSAYRTIEQPDQQ